MKGSAAKRSYRVKQNTRRGMECCVPQLTVAVFNRSCNLCDLRTIWRLEHIKPHGIITAELKVQPCSVGFDACRLLSDLKSNIPPTGLQAEADNGRLDCATQEAHEAYLRHRRAPTKTVFFMAAALPA